MGCTVKVRNTTRGGLGLRAVARRASDVSPAWPRVSRYLSGEVRRQFSTQGAYFGTPWRPLTAAYRMRKRQMGGGNKILVLSGEMRSSFMPFNLQEMSGNTAKFGSTNQKALWHNFGTHRNGKQVNPARTILKVTPKMTGDVRDILSKYIVGRAGR